MEIQGFFYTKNSSKRHAANFNIDGGACHVLLDDNIVITSNIDSLQISQRISNMPRQIRFEDNSMFETLDNGSIDAWLKQYKHQRGSSLLHILESNVIFLVPLLFLAVGIAWFTYTWGLPKASKAIAFSLPAAELSIISSKTIETLDATLLKPSQLEDSVKADIRKRFEQLTSEIGSGFKYHLYFRSIGDDMPNAFALPDGSIVLLDGLVHLAEDPWEIDSVLLHEIAHVEQRHGLQMVFQDTLITLMVSLMLGDAVSTGDAVLSLPVLLVQNQYSQDFEQSSDDFASDYMLKNNIDNIYFSRMLGKLGQAIETDTPKEEKTFDSYFANHPAMQKRIARINEKVIRNP